jgi:hypothetical protein
MPLASFSSLEELLGQGSKVVDNEKLPYTASSPLPPLLIVSN